MQYHDDNNNKIRSEYVRRVKKILKSHLNSRNVVTGINSRAVSIIRYSAGIIEWTEKELKDLDRKTRKLMTLHCMLHEKGDVDRPYGNAIGGYQEKIVIVLELTCGFVTNMKENCARKVGKYNSTTVDLKKKYEKVTFVNLSMSALGLICRDDDGNGILQALKSIGLSELLSKNIIGNIINICIRTMYYIFCMKNK